MERIRPKLIFKDKRGRIENIYCGVAWRELNMFRSKKGVTRGGHYHKKTRELIFVIKGKIEFSATNIRTRAKRKVILKEGEGVVVEPYELHEARIVEKAVWIAALTKEYKDDKPDVFQKF